MNRLTLAASTLFSVSTFFGLACTSDDSTDQPGGTKTSGATGTSTTSAASTTSGASGGAAGSAAATTTSTSGAGTGGASTVAAGGAGGSGSGTGGASGGGATGTGGATGSGGSGGTAGTAGAAGTGGMGGADGGATSPPPPAVMPVPTADQLTYQRLFSTAFFHFGPNTFDGDEVGDGTANPTIFNPTALDATQWVSTLKNAGFKQGILVVKHHDGFCLWPTKCSDYNVSKSPWKNGQGDVIKEFTDAAHAANFRVGLYLSPLDNHAADSSSSAGYGTKFQCMIDEILQNYGRVDEIWFDGNSAPSSVNATLYAHIKQISPHTLIFAGPEIAANGVDIRWIGTESGTAPAGTTNVQQLQGKTAWYPSECDVSIRSNWFWHPNDSAKSLTELTDIFFNSVGHNCTLLLNVPPNQQGLLDTNDVARLGQLGASLHNMFVTNLAAGQPITADSTWQATDYAATKATDGNLDTYWAAGTGKTTGRLEIDLGASKSIKIVDVSEAIVLGEHVTKYHVETQAAGATSWTTIGSGTAIGARNLIRGTWTAQKVALVIEQAKGVPAIAEFGVY